MVFEFATIGFAGIFFAILIVLHFLKREIDPTWRMISEYEIGRFGWLMRIAFFCWGVSALALLISIWPWLGSVSGMISRGWLVLIVISLFGAGIFKTNPITDTATNTANSLHMLFGMIVILTFPIVASLAVHSLLQNKIWSESQGQLIYGTVLVWTGLIAYFGSIIISRIIDPSAGRVGPKVYQGWPNRFMAATYVTWFILIAANALRIL